MRRRNLRPQQRQLRSIQPRAKHRPKHRREIRRRDGRHQARDVAERAVQRRDRRVPEIVAHGDRLHEVQWRVACPDYGDGARGKDATVGGGEVASFAEGLEGLDDDGPGACSVSFEVNEQVERLAATGVEDAIVCGGR